MIHTQEYCTLSTFKENIRNSFEDMNFTDREIQELGNELKLLDECEQRLPKIKKQKKINVRASHRNCQEEKRCQCQERQNPLRRDKKQYYNI